MSLRMYVHEVEELVAEAYLQKKSAEFTLPSNIGNGYLRAMAIGELFFEEQSYNFSQDLILVDMNSSAINSDYCFLILTVAGQSSYRNYSQNNIEHQFSKNKISLGFASSISSYNLRIAKNVMQQYSFMLSKEKLLEYVIEFDNLELINKIKNATNFEIFREMELTPVHHFIIKKMLNNPFHGSLQKLYLETCANELFMVLLQDIVSKKTFNLTLTAKDKQQVEKAKQILLANSQNPPTTAELAKMVHINRDKLNKGFNVLFGNSVFKTLTQHRMQLAHQQLQNNDKSINEIAFDTGYENVTNFINAFKKEYGITPGKMRKNKVYYI